MTPDNLVTAVARAKAKLKQRMVIMLEQEGYERSLIYKTLLATGLRKGELASVTLSDVELDCDHPLIDLKAENEKSRRGAKISLPPALARELQRWINFKLSAVGTNAIKEKADTPLFNVPTALDKIFNRDIKAAGIDKVDARERVIDVHALRTTFGTWLSAIGVPLRIAQAAMRHSDPKLTANVYTDPQALDISGAVAKLPQLDSGINGAIQIDPGCVNPRPNSGNALFVPPKNSGHDKSGRDESSQMGEKAASNTENFDSEEM